MAWEWRVLFVGFLLAGAACAVIGLVVIIRSRDAEPNEQRPHTTRFKTSRWEFEQSTTSAGLSLVGLGLIMWFAAAFVVVTARDGSDDTEAIAAGEQLAQLPPVTPTTAPRTVPPQTLPATPTVVIPLSDSALTAESAVSLPCDGLWAVSLGSTEGKVKSPDQFLTDSISQFGDATLRLIAANSCSSLAADTWVVIGGVHPSSADAVAECLDRGLFDGDLCFALPLTNSVEDRNVRVFP